MSIIGTILIGFIVGLLAKFVMPGRDPGGFFVTAAIGIVGSLIATFGGRALGIYRGDETELHRRVHRRYHFADPLPAPRAQPQHVNHAPAGARTEPCRTASAVVCNADPSQRTGHKELPWHSTLETCCRNT